MFTLDCDRAYLYAHPERELTPGEMQRYDEALARRATGVPAQYITGHQEFWGLDLIVSPAVLIPRPETEHVVEAVLELAGQSKSESGRGPRTGVPHTICASSMWVPVRERSPLHWPKSCRPRKSTPPIFLPKRWKSPGPMQHGTNLLRASSFIRPICWIHPARKAPTASRLRSTSWFRILPTSASRKKIPCSSKCANSSRGMRCLRGRRGGSDRAADSAGARGARVRADGWYSKSAGRLPIACDTCSSDWNEVEIRNDLQGIARVAMARKATLS